MLPADEVLVAGLRSGDEAAFVSVLDAWSGSMSRLARGFVSADASAEEVLDAGDLGSEPAGAAVVPMPIGVNSSVEPRRQRMPGVRRILVMGFAHDEDVV